MDSKNHDYYSEMISYCFKKCVDSFNTNTLVDKEKECVKQCRVNYFEIIK